MKNQKMIRNIDMTRQCPQKTGNLYTYWWNKGSNFGDVMNPLLLNRLTGYDIKWSNSENTPVFVAAGSLIDTFHTKPGWTIWGSGIISTESGIPENLELLALRGPRTRNHLAESGYSNIPESYGDPGLLLPLVFPAHNPSPRYDIGIIPHYAFRLNPAMHIFKNLTNINNFCKKGLRIRIISPKLPVLDFLRALNDCKVIAANSLHGLIVSRAYGKLAQWIHFRNDPLEGAITSPFVGDDFKYQDFLESIGRYGEQPILVEKARDFDHVIENVKHTEPCNFDAEPLLEAFPYKTKNWDQHIQRASAYFSSLAKGNLP